MVDIELLRRYRLTGWKGLLTRRYSGSILLLVSLVFSAAAMLVEDVLIEPKIVTILEYCYYPVYLLWFIRLALLFKCRENILNFFLRHISACLLFGIFGLSIIGPYVNLHIGILYYILLPIFFIMIFQYFFQNILRESGCHNLRSLWSEYLWTRGDAINIEESLFKNVYCCGILPGFILSSFSCFCAFGVFFLFDYIKIPFPKRVFESFTSIDSFLSLILFVVTFFAITYICIFIGLKLYYYTKFTKDNDIDTYFSNVSIVNPYGKSITPLRIWGNRLFWLTYILLFAYLYVTHGISPAGANPHKFTCTDISIDASHMSFKEVQKMKNEVLGTEITLEFYDNNVKYTGKDGDKYESIVFDKISDNLYEIRNHDDRFNGVGLLELQKTLWYIPSFTLSLYDGDKQQVRMTFKK